MDHYQLRYEDEARSFFRGFAEVLKADETLTAHLVIRLPAPDRGDGLVAGGAAPPPPPAPGPAATAQRAAEGEGGQGPGRGIREGGPARRGESPPAQGRAGG